MRLEGQDGWAITTVDEWFQHAPPRRGAFHWRDGRSAKELAKSWCPAEGGPRPPTELVQLLHRMNGHGDWEFEVGYPERRVRFDARGGEPRNTDLAIHCVTQLGRVGVSVEAKVDEGFDSLVGEAVLLAAARWTSDEQDGKLRRIQELCAAVLPPRRLREDGLPSIGALRYQLLAAAAGAWAFAGEIEAPTAVLVVHTFMSPEASPGKLRRNSTDLNTFVERITRGIHRTLEAGQLIGPLQVPASPHWPGVREWFIGKCETDLGGGGVQPDLL